MMRELKNEVTLSVQRHGSEPPPPPVLSDPSPRQPPPPEPPTNPPPNRTKLSLNVPLVAPDGRPLGLGISVKGKSMNSKREPRQDHGIFVKAVLPGGAADLNDSKGGGVAFSEDVQAIPRGMETLDSDEDVIFVGQLEDTENDPFSRDNILRKSKKLFDHPTVKQQGLGLTLRRASSHDSLVKPSPSRDMSPSTPMKRGLSQESIFLNKDIDPDPKPPVNASRG
eukprot:sb/3469712/